MSVHLSRHDPIDQQQNPIATMETQDCDVPVKKFTIPKLRSRPESTGDASLQNFLANLKTNRSTDTNCNGSAGVEKTPKFAIPKLRDQLDDPAHSSFLLNIRRGKAESTNNTKDNNTDKLISNLSTLTINSVKMRDASVNTYDVDLTTALHVPGPRKRSNESKRVEDVEDISFEDHFVDCDMDLNGTMIVDDRLKCNIDLSKMKNHKCELVARRHSPFGKVACGRLRSNDAPASNFFAFTRTAHNIEPFDFKTLSPDDIILQRLHGKN